jgi:hypothetical protein
VTRREFLAFGAGLAAGCRRGARRVTGSFAGASYDVGHLLRNGSIPAPKEKRRVPVVIVGGGVAGLSAGWHLARHGFQDFEILELEEEAGGNSRFGENRISAYPWGAHYVPQPTKDSRYVRELFEELGVITGYANGEPVYKDEYVCFDPQERLYIHGRWQDGLIPSIGTTDRDHDDLDRFDEIIADFKARRAFTIPMEFSRQDKDLLALDSVSIRDFLDARGLHSLALHWYVNYACRDDFGCTSGDVSAWAGIHYFASRDVDQNAVLTWPEGNGWIVKRLREKLRNSIRPGALAFRVTQGQVDYYDVHEKTSTTIHADRIIFACPTFLAKFLVENPPATDAFDYAPWLVANLTMEAFPMQRAGVPLAWDNVIHDSDALGYVVATHQSLRIHQPQTVFTFYYPLAGSSPKDERTRLLSTDWKTWTNFILDDLSRPHPEIRELVSNIDIMRWGHAMVRPRPGFMWNEARRRFTRPFGRIHFAHSDLSGFSLFEEAQYRGVIAAQWVLDAR